ncbi:signal peptide-containing protein [Cryptosporidium canis]|uniref:Signal peptide-containing protein n=1 Tax=Cryptosporidium canis TaxID=195482 RepID=A0A9D5DLQ3_9CRYT|nr:signal peptide-containing protein [Cryptosporidium canis]
MLPLQKWCILPLFVTFVVYLQIIEAGQAEEALNIVVSCLKHDIFAYNPPKFPACQLQDSSEVSEACIEDISVWVRSIEEVFNNKLRSDQNGAFVSNLNLEGTGDILDSGKVISTIKDAVSSNASAGKGKTSCSTGCHSKVVGLLQSLETPSEIISAIHSFLCNSRSFTMETCVESVELSIDGLLDQNNKKVENVKRSTALKICYNIGLAFGRSSLFLGHMFDLLAFDFSTQEQLGVTISQLTGKSLSKLSLGSEFIYIFDSIRKIRIKETFFTDTNDNYTNVGTSGGSRTGRDVLDLDNKKSTETPMEYSYSECQFGADLFFKLYLIPTQRSELFCKVFFLYRGFQLPEDIIDENRHLTQIPELRDSRKAIKTQIESSLMKFDIKKENMLRLSRFQLFSCFESLSNKNLKLDISIISGMCYFIYREVGKDLVELFDIHTAYFVSLVLIWLSQKADSDLFQEISQMERAVYTTEFGRSVTYSLLQAMNEGFDITECKRHLELLNEHEPFLSQGYPPNYDFPFVRLMHPSPINKEYVSLICSKKSLVFQIFSRVNPLREFIPATQPTKITYKAFGSGEDSKGAQKNIMGTKEIFDAALQLYFAGDVPRGYLLNAVSFSIVGLKAFLRNTLTFLSQETIMARYDDIQHGKAIVTPFSDVLSLMGISGSYNNQLNAQEQLSFTNKYICSGSSENIDVRIKNTNIVKFVGSPFYIVAKDSKNNSKNMFNFVNCVDEFILVNWSNARYSLLKSDPILFCSLIGTYLARDYSYIQSEVNKYAIYVTYFEMTGNVLPKKCMDVNFSNIPYIKHIEDITILSEAFVNCVKSYSTLTDFISTDELSSLSESFSIGVLQYVDKPLSLHSSSIYGRLLTYILEKHPIIGKERAGKIILSLNPIYGFNYDQLISKLTENNIPLKESAIITGFIGEKMGGNTKKLDFEFINWLENYSGHYLPFENHPGLKENILKFFSGQETVERSDCIKNIREMFDKFQVPTDTSPDLICDEWGALFENYPRRNSYMKFIALMNENPESPTKTLLNTINLRITRSQPIGISTKVNVDFRDTPLISLVSVLARRGLLDPKKEILEGFQTDSQAIILSGQGREMDVSAKSIGLNDGDIIHLIVKDLEPKAFDMNVSWKDSNTREEGSFILSTKDISLRQLFEDLNKREELQDRIIKSLLLPNGKILDPQSGILDQSISEHSIGTSDKVELVTILKNVSSLSLRLIWRNPCVLEIIPSIDDEGNSRGSFVKKEIQISSNEVLKDMFNEIKAAIMEATFGKGDKFGVEKFEISSIEILGNDEKEASSSFGHVQRIIQNSPEHDNTYIYEMGIRDYDKVLVNLNIEPSKIVSIISKAQKLSYIAKFTSIPHNPMSETEFQYGLFYALNMILENNIDLYDILVHEKYFTDKDSKATKGHYINISPRVKTFNSVEKLAQNSVVLLNSKKSIKKDGISLVTVLKDTPDISKTIKFQAVMSASKVSDLLKSSFGKHIKPDGLFTTNGKEIKITDNDSNIIFGDIPLKDGDVLYLTCSKPSFDKMNGVEGSTHWGGISFERVQELLNSYGYIIQQIGGKNDPLVPNESLEYPKKFNDLHHLEMFVRQLVPSINSERLINESQEHIFQKDYRFPSALERLVPLLNEDFLGVQVDYDIIKELGDTYGLFQSKEGDIFDFLGCIRSFRSFFFYNKPTKEVYSARIYNVCKRIAGLLLKRETWIMEQGVTGAFISILEDEQLHPIDVEREAPFLNTVSAPGLLGSECVEITKSVLERLKLNSHKVKGLLIPITVDPRNVCITLQSFVNNYDDVTGEYEKVVQVLPAYKLSHAIDSNFPRFWEENTFGALIPSISEVKSAINPLFDFSKTFQFITSHLEVHLKLLKEYPSCSILLAAFIIRNIMISSGISPLVFMRKLVQFALEKEYTKNKDTQMTISHVLFVLEKNPYLSSANNIDEAGSSWIWNSIKGNQIKEITDLGAELNSSKKLLLIFSNSGDLCPGSLVPEESKLELGSDIRALINYFTEGILAGKSDSKQLFEQFKINDLAIISRDMDLFRGDSFYKIIKENIVEIIQNDTTQMKKDIGYLDVESFDRENVPFIVSVGVISSVWENKQSKPNAMQSFMRFFIHEIFLNLGINLGNIEIQHITDGILDNFDWSKMRISKESLVRILGGICPVNSARFIECENIEAIEEIADLIVRVIESEDPIKIEGFKPLTTGTNLNIKFIPRAHFFRTFRDPKSRLEEDRIEEINKALAENGYPKKVLSTFNDHIREALRTFNREIVHVGRLGKMVLSPRQEHIGAILLSYGYSNIQSSSLLNNFDHIHCFSSLLDIISDEPKRLDHYYQICMSICMEVEEISHFSCEGLQIQTITSMLLSEEKPQALKRLISFLKYDHIFEHDLGVLREIYLDHKSQRLTEKWLNLIRNMKHYTSFYSIINKFKPHVDKILMEKEMKEPSSGFGIIDLVGELISCWTRENGEDFIRKFFITNKYPMELMKPFSTIWPGDGRNRINLKISIPGKGTIKRLKASLNHEIETRELYKTESSGSMVDEMIEKLGESALGVKFWLLDKIPASMHKFQNIKMAENGVNVENVISKLDKNGPISIYLSMDECIVQTKKQIVNHLDLSYSQVLLFCIGIISEISYRKSASLNELDHNFVKRSVQMRNELYFVTILYGFYYALNRILQDFLTKNQIREYLISMKHNLYQLSNQNGIFNFVTKFIIHFKLPVDPNVLSFYIKEVILDSNSGINLDKVDEIKAYQNVPDIVLSNKGFYKLVFEISKELFDSVGDELEKKHFTLLFKEKDVQELIERGFNPINIQEFTKKITNKNNKKVTIEFGRRLGMNSLNFKLAYAHKIFQSKIQEALKEENISSVQRQFITAIGSNVSPTDKLVYELIYTSRENCLLEMIKKYTSNSNQVKYGLQFEYALKFCNELLIPLEKVTHDIDKAFGPDYIGGLASCDRIRINQETEKLKSEINNIMNYLNNLELITSLFEMKRSKDLVLEKSISYVERKIERSNRHKVIRVFNKWDQPIYRKILLEIQFRRTIFNFFMSYLDHHVFIVIPMFRKILETLKKDIDIIEYQKTKKTLSKLILTLVTVKNPYSVPNVMKNNTKIKGEYLRQANRYKSKAALQERKDISIFGISLLPYYLKISWYSYYLSILFGETNVLLNQLPNFNVSKINKVKDKKTHTLNFPIQFPETSDRHSQEVESPSKGISDNSKPKKKNEKFKIFKRIQRYFKKRFKSNKL